MRQAFELTIEGMHCQACVRRVERALAEIPGIVVDELVVGRVRGVLDGSELTAVAGAITAAGYPTSVPTAG